MRLGSVSCPLGEFNAKLENKRLISIPLDSEVRNGDESDKIERVE
jgi:hypothetical protein